MTAIAWDGTQLVCDRAEFAGNQKFENCKLVLFHNNPDGRSYMFAGCGDTVNIAAVVDWIRKGFTDKPNCERTDTLNAGASVGILVDDKGKAFNVYPTGHMEPVYGPFTADGSAHEFLMGCLASGTSARKAVELAVKHRADAGFGVDSFFWEDLQSYTAIDQARKHFNKSIVLGERE